MKANQLPSASRHADALEAELAEAIKSKLTYSLGKSFRSATDNDWYHATALAVRDRVVDVWMQSRRETNRLKKRRVYYLSIEFLIGRLLLDTLTNLRLVEPTRRALASLGVDLERLRSGEPDAALGNGGLGRLAACFMDSMSALAIPAYGYGIRYENGLFEQRIIDGWQHEVPEDWLANGNPWEFMRPDTKIPIGFGGSVEFVGDTEATMRAVWTPADIVLAVPYDTPIVGWRGRHCNALRLWSARVADPIHLATFNDGDLVGATAARARAEAISRVLYPNDGTPVGQELRLRQEYFFTSATLQDLTNRHLDEFDTLDNLADYAAVQLNDTHPAIAVAELMRILVDEHQIDLAESVGDHARDLELHQPHAAAGSAGKLAGRSARPPAAAPFADHLHDQLDSSAGPRKARPQRRRISSPPYRWSRTMANVACAWRIWRSSARIASTASRRCIPNCSRTRCLTT